jgi:hypothetical protein
MSISRKHAAIRYNFELRCFELVVMGKNGVTMESEVITPDLSPVALKSGVKEWTARCALLTRMHSRQHGM